MYRVERTKDRFFLTHPEEAFDAAAIASFLRSQAEVTFSIRPGEASERQLEIGAEETHLDGVVNALFATLNGYPARSSESLAKFLPAEEPILSCIILTCFNSLFVHNVLLPSIIENSVGHSIEIILVNAGFGADLRPFERLVVVPSEMGCTSKGYNAGVRASRGRYIALFHDDCYLDDPQWLDKVLTELESNADCVVPEQNRWYGIPFGKAVPLVMRREDYLQLGGHDEYYYVGVEDMDLSCAMHATGLRQVRMNFGYRHLRGMGSSLVVHEHPYDLKLLFGYQILREPVIKAIHTQSMTRLLEHDFIRFLEAQYHLHFIEKFQNWLEPRTTIPLADLQEMYLRKRHPYLLTPYATYASNRQAILDAYYAMMNVEELSRAMGAAT